jgi:small GTP-binding protein
VEVWDTAGQEEYRSLGPIFYRNASIALVVFDVSNSKTFSSIPDWITSFKHVTGNQSAVFLIGNKTDLGNRQVSKSEATEWAEERNAPYFETSALTGEGVRQLFDGVIQALGERVPIIQRAVAPVKPSSTKSCC